jgi:hypothetical protein
LAKIIASASQTTLFFLINNINNYPLPHGGFTCSNITEFDYLDFDEKGVVNGECKRVQHFSLNSYTIISVMDSPKDPRTARVIFRDLTGRFAWYQFQYKYKGI